MNILQGSVVKSLAGHDRNSYFVAVGIEERYAYIADGRERKLESPKKKNIKHLSVTAKSIDLQEITNNKLRKLLNELSRNGE